MAKKRLPFWFVLVLFLLNIISGAHATDTLYIVFTANINGMIEHCHCGKEPLGGVARIKTFINEIRAAHNHVLVIDGGDYLNTYPFLELNQALAKSQHVINFDAMVPGDQEFVEGPEFISELQQMNGSRWVISNLKDYPQKKKQLKAGSIDVEISGYLSPQSFSFIALPVNKSFSTFAEAFKTKTKNRTKTLQILIAHADTEEARNIMTENPWIDVMLLGHAQTQLINDVDERPIIACGRDGEYVVLIKLFRIEESWQYNVGFIKIDAQIGKNAEINQIISKFNRVVAEKY